MPLANREGRARWNTRSKIRSYFQTPDHEEGHSCSSEEEEPSPNKLVNVARDVRRRLSRTDSSQLRSPSLGASAASSSSRLFAADTPDSRLVEEQVVKDQIQEKVWTDTLAAKNHVSTPIDEDKHPDSVMSPIRRRSLYTPGIATRSPEDILRKPPLPVQTGSEADRDYYYNPARPQSSPLSRLANLRSFPNGRSTPSELDYTHLGALKLGTLRVTNGAASPVPRELNISPGPTSSVDTSCHDEYHTASEGGKSEPAAHSAIDLVSESGSCALQRESFNEPTMPTVSNRMANGRHSIDVTNAASPVPATYNCIRRKPVPSMTPLRQRDEASYAADDHIPGLSNSADPIQAATNVAEHGSRGAAFIKLNGRQSLQGEVNEPSCEVQDHVNKYPLDQDSQPIDSGYNSNISLDTTEGSKSISSYQFESRSPYVPESFCETRSMQRLSDRQDIHLKAQSSISDVSKDPTIASALEWAPTATDRPSATILLLQSQPLSPEKPRKLQKKRPRSQPPIQRTPLSAGHSLIENDIPPVPTAIADYHSRRVSKFPVLDHTYADFQHTDIGKISSSTTSTIVQTRFPSPTYGSQDPSMNERPSLFQKLASRARSRSQSRPRAQQSSHDSDDESVISICRNPSWSEYGNKKKKQQRRNEKAEVELRKHSESRSSIDPEARSRSKSRSRSRFRSRSRRRSSPREPSPTLTDFGTVRESLGASPYDIAKIGHGLQQQVVGRALQPHQIGTTKPCLESRKDMYGSNIASNRLRSRSVLGYNEAEKEDIQTHRSGSLKPARPSSMYVGYPPVPPLPSVEVAQRNYTSRPRLVSEVQSSGTPLQPESTIEAPCALVIAPSAKPTTSIEELIDRLLDAPDSDCREIILEQIRQRKRGTEARPSNNSEQTNSEKREPPEVIRGLDHPPQGSETVINQSAMPMSCDVPDTKTPSSERAKASRDDSRGLTNSTNISADAPPIPPLPTAEYLREQEGRRSIAKSKINKTLSPPHVQAPEPSKKDLWAGCTLQTEHRKANGPRSDWDSHRLAWSQRRKSAGEALLLKDRQPEPAGAAHNARDGGAPQERWQPSAITRAMTAGSEQPPVSISGPKAFHKPWVSPPSQQMSSNHATTSFQPSNTAAATAQAFERLTGRFEGGLLYGYEPGFGLGGSAGTRSTKTGATRKSIQFSQGFGVDLSDVPIFVAPSK
ncbi:MAG: hypothetical protein Q9170_000058 [Blastenia crenularia]